MDTPNPDPRLTPYTLNNDLLPEDLIPVLSSFLHALHEARLSIENPVALLPAGAKEKAQQHDTSTTGLVATESGPAVKKIQALQAQYSVIRAPIRSLPTELIPTIFCWVLELKKHDHLDLYGRDYPETDPFTFNLLRRVCRTWNQVAISTSVLWRSLELDLERWVMDIENPNALSNFVETWFNRAGSGNPPLRLSILSAYSPLFSELSCEQKDIFISQMRSILTARRNWSEWYVDGCPAWMAILNLGGLDGAFMGLNLEDDGPRPWDNLRRLSIDLSETSSWSREINGYGLFIRPSPLPKLESLCISYRLTYLWISAESNYGAFLHYPTSLRSLHLCGSPYFLPASLANFPSLEELILEPRDSTSFGFCSEFLESEPVVLDGLKRLVLVGSAVDVHYLKRVLPTLILPSLHLLRFVQVTHPAEPGLASNYMPPVDPREDSEDDVSGESAAVLVGRLLSQSQDDALTLSFEDSGMPWLAIRDLLVDLNQSGSCNIRHLRVDNLSCGEGAEPAYSSISKIATLESIACRSDLDYGEHHFDWDAFFERDSSLPLPILHLSDAACDPGTRWYREWKQRKCSVEIQFHGKGELDSLFDYGIVGHQHEWALEFHRRKAERREAWRWHGM
ncbi:hypothetical protein CC1G_10562 [Coprinopsis cinerea okayama7|uniref:Uncharacterized protein n=1 Tax=Coprinopsis cinerea (strain Okayama-7 / 130 / ATCC MYA-4618 / FGSC 9003) TaxID=240176 RepID=A8NDX6_COPC7|nr:hypothetical protein CC1G_10562 [Coprinopsis cinerea okayama7\|eukprot:XP_001832886.2 hypothetical protein CC1G_10562 [Coprinopsis cinerea okayama7\